MKTRFFRGSEAVANKQFREDVHRLASLEGEAAVALAREVARAHHQDLDPLGSVDYSAISSFLVNSKTADKDEDISSLTRISEFLFDKMTDLQERYDPIAVSEDFAEVLRLESSEQDVLRSFLVTLAESASEYCMKALQRLTEETGIPSFTGIGTLVDLRAIIKDFYTFAHRSDDSPYNPTVSHFVVRGTISLQLARYRDKRVAFQVTAEELDLLLETLEALRTDMKKVCERALPLLSPLKVDDLLERKDERSC